MKTYNILKALGLAAVASLVLTSCEDFLDTTQRGVIPQEDFYQTDDEATQAVMAVYDGVQSNNLNFFQLKNILSDDAQAGGGSRSDNTYGNEINEFTFGAANTFISGEFEKYYQIIYRANLVITKVPGETTVQKYCIAEAKALRAYAYFELVTLWGTVPLVTEPLEAGNYAQPNSTVEAIWAQIETDLAEAADVLPVRSKQVSEGLDYSRVSKGYAQALLGKAYLYQEEYSAAAEMFQTVIDSGEYELYSDFSKVTMEETEFGKESLFEINYVADISYETEANYIHAYCGPRAPWFQPGTTGMSNSAWGWCAPETSINEFMEERNDPRKSSTVWDTEDLAEYGAGWGGNGDASIPYGCDGLVRVKYGTFLSEIAEQNESYHCVGGTNYRLMRYADVLLMAAEAYNRSGNDSRAQTYINEVRARVGLDGLSSTGDELFQDIKDERRAELAFEFVRWQDLVRWGEAYDVLKDSGKLTNLGSLDANGDFEYWENASAGMKSYNVLLPFPEEEMLVNEYIVQNEGY